MLPLFCVSIGNNCYDNDVHHINKTHMFASNYYYLGLNRLPNVEHSLMLNIDFKVYIYIELLR